MTPRSWRYRWAQPPAAESLRTVLALGADRAVLVSDETAQGSDLLATARVLAAVLDRENPTWCCSDSRARTG